MKYWLTVIVLLFLGLFSFGLISQNSHAQKGGGQGLEISPPLIDIRVDPGQKVTTKIKVRNVTKETLVVEAEYNDFVSSGEYGQPKILLKDDEESPYSIKNWLSTIPSSTLAPQQQATFDVVIDVPKNASPGGHYGVVRYTGTPAGPEGSGVTLSASIGTLFLVNVSGDVQESAKISDLFSARDGKKRSLFEYGPVGIVTKIQNTGNVHIKPKGTIRITNMLGNTVQENQFNPKGGNVLPQSTRKFDELINKKLLFGRYTIQADITYGENNTIISNQANFWVIPYKLIALLIVLVVGIFFAVKWYNKFIVKRASKKRGTTSAKQKEE